MNLIKPIRALGIMNGTSVNEAGLSLISTDGIDVYEFLAHEKIPYSDELKGKILSFLGKEVDNDKDLAELNAIGEELTDFYYDVAKEFIKKHGDVDVIGIDGNTIYCDVKKCIINQIGNHKKLASLLGVKVVSNFHKSDILSGGQGFPLTPSYYSALTSDLDKPIVIVNIGGVSSITWIGSHGEMMSFDSGPGNLAINDWVQRHGGMYMDYNGKLAITGKIDEKILNSLMKHKYFALYPPKSIEAKFFEEKLEHLEGLTLEDGAATVTAFVAESIVYSMLMYIPQFPNSVIICGGGSKNPTLVRFIKQRLVNVDVKAVSEIGLNVDAMDAGIAGFLAVRRLNLLPISFPSTTGVYEPMVGGDISQP